MLLIRHLHAHLHRYSWVRIVSIDDKVIVCKVLNVRNVTRPAKGREWAGLAFQLYIESVDVIAIYMSVAKLNN